MFCLWRGRRDTRTVLGQVMVTGNSQSADEVTRSCIGSLVNRRGTVWVGNGHHIYMLHVGWGLLHFACCIYHVVVDLGSFMLYLLGSLLMRVCCMLYFCLLYTSDAADE